MTALRIPKIMHHIWIGGPMPSHLSANIRAWADMHPDWDMKLWTEREIDDIGLQNQALYDQAVKIVPSDAVEQFRADIARYEILAYFGGMYTDVDTRPLRNIESALDGHSEFAAREDRTWIGNTYLAATPNHPIMQEIIARMPANVHRLRGRRPNKLSGPQYITPIWNRHNGHVAPQRQWFPYSYIDVKRQTVPDTFAEDVYAVHGWDHTRRVLASRPKIRSI
jgi:mannosyltransferase OCH1-like enzyme